jgi:hypothetical protein
MARPNPRLTPVTIAVVPASGSARFSIGRLTVIVISIRREAGIHRCATDEFSGPDVSVLM